MRAALERLVELHAADAGWGPIWGDAIAAARAALAQPEGEGPSERIISIAKAVQECAFSWEPDARLIGNVCAEDVADLCAAALTRWGRPVTPPAPDSPAESLAARPLLEKVARLDNSVGITVAEVRQLAGQAAAWLRSNPPGQPVAIEPRGCPTPGACSCVVPTAPPAPEHAGGSNNDEQREAVCAAVTEALGNAYDCLRVWCAWGVGTMGPDDFVLVADDDDRVAEIADAAIEAMRPAGPPAPAGVPVAVAVAVSERLPDPRPESEGGDCDAEGRCWWFSPPACGAHKIRRRSCWTLDSEAMEGDSHWRPASAIPLPWAGEAPNV
jgi:hypothetical protein